MTRWFQATDGGKWHAMDPVETADGTLVASCGMDTADAAGSVTGTNTLALAGLCDRCRAAQGLPDPEGGE